MVKLLLSNGADKTITNDCNKTALYYASDKSTIDIVNVSIKKYNHHQKRDWQVFVNQ
jgi:ankyrin repeat protein